ncbi:hypothetical protein ASA1KI_28900 [Opitutales bacterium ASA1]|uniref:DUF3482 domain-containing protein n=1 Tax=Congregicoccus parvus TaxID=3081749 RepID=UPI002B30651C|nr:hypothetical protein ASA1KI_28900 [Opitutales bacterium ASA1]
MNTITLTIAGHTNAGKTALARTLLGRDVGEVRDAPHVTDRVDTQTWVTVDGWRLQLADTPGLDSAPRLLGRLRHAGNPLGWFLRELWDRTTDPGFYHTQIALRQVARETDVVLLVVDTAALPDGPDETTRAELQLVALFGRPILIVLNQTGRPWTRDEQSRVEESWRRTVRDQTEVRGVTTLDAFTRAWVCELRLLDLIAPMLPADRREGLRMLARALEARHADVFEKSMQAIASVLRDAAEDREQPARHGFVSNAGRVFKRIVSNKSEDDEIEAMHARLQERLGQRYARLVDRLIELHGLSGRSALREVATGAADLVGGPRSRVLARELAWAAAGGAGAGGAIDAAVGGISFGAGMAFGAVVGALAAIGLGARDLSTREDAKVGWRIDAVARHLVVCLRAYLCVAHYGRGQGTWRDHAGPAHWNELVESVLARRRDVLERALAERGDASSAEVMRSGAEVLTALYPEVASGIDVLRAARAPSAEAALQSGL